MYVTFDFICIGLVKLRGTRRKQELQNEKILPKVGFNPSPFRLQFGRSIELRHGFGLMIFYLM